MDFPSLYPAASTVHLTLPPNPSQLRRLSPAHTVRRPGALPGSLSSCCRCHQSPQWHWVAAWPVPFSRFHPAHPGPSSCCQSPEGP